MCRIMKKGLHIVGWLLLVYFIISVLLGIFTYLIPVRADHMEQPEVFCGSAEGPDRAYLVESPADAFSRRIELIRSAQHSLDLVCHCVKEGESADCLFGEILAAADRGVKVRVMLDGAVGGLSGSRRDIEFALRAHPNVELRSYNPIDFLRPWTWNVRLHDKFILADDRLMMLGGRNMGDEYFDPPGYEGAVTYDRDVVVWNTGSEEGSVTDQIKTYMEQLWTAPETQLPKPLSQWQTERGKQEQIRLKDLSGQWEEAFSEYYLPEVRVETLTLPTRRISLLANPVSDFKKAPVLGATLASLLEKCDSIRIQTPYATANRHTLAALTQLAEGASVDFLTNSMASSPNYPAFSAYHFQRDRFLETGIHIFEYQSTDSIHGKSCTADGHLSVVGSFNLDDRSLYINTESVLVIDSPEFCKTLNSSLNKLFSQSAEVAPDNTYALGQCVQIVEPSVKKQMLMRLVSVFSRTFQFLI